MEYGMPYLCNGATLYYVKWIIIYYSDCKSILDVSAAMTLDAYSKL